MASRSWPTVVDLFSGSGAVTSALKKRRFRVVAAVDSDSVACATYRANHKSVHLIQEDICRVDPTKIRDEQLDGRDLDLLVVCAPCQPFSTQNQKRKEDGRSLLILQTGRFAQALRPRMIFFENVPGIASRGELLEQLRHALGSDYTLSEPHKVDAADYGVPQRRVRCIMLAVRNGVPPSLPPKTTPAGRRRTVREAIFDLARLRSGERDGQDELHIARDHRPIALRRLAAIPKDGGSRSALPLELQLACHRAVKSSAYSDVYGRMGWDDVAPTLTTGCTDITRGRFAHPEDDRAITLREAALLQTFPSGYRFAGSNADIATQIGNAVPAQLIDALTTCFRAGIGGAGT